MSEKSGKPPKSVEAILEPPTVAPDANDYSRKRKPPKRGILDKFEKQEGLDQRLAGQITTNDPVGFLGGIYHVVAVDKVKDTVSFYVGDQKTTVPRSCVSKALSSAHENKLPIRRRR